MNQFKNFETRNGVFIKLGVLATISIGIFLVGKKHIAVRKEQRHIKETDARIESSEFEPKPLRPGIASDSNLERESKYVGAGGAYSTRKKGDKFTMFNLFDKGE